MPFLKYLKNMVSMSSVSLPHLISLRGRGWQPFESRRNSTRLSFKIWRRQGIPYYPLASGRRFRENKVWSREFRVRKKPVGALFLALFTIKKEIFSQRWNLLPP